MTKIYVLVFSLFLITKQIVTKTSRSLDLEKAIDIFCAHKKKFLETIIIGHVENYILKAAATDCADIKTFSRKLYL